MKYCMLTILNSHLCKFDKIQNRMEILIFHFGGFCACVTFHFIGEILSEKSISNHPLPFRIPDTRFPHASI